MARKIILFALAAVVFVLPACGDDEDQGPQAPAREVFIAELRGTSEVPPVTTTATGNARVEFTPTGLSWVVNVSGITGVLPGGAHIHAPATTSAVANVVLNLFPDNTVTTGQLAAGTATATNANQPISMDSLKVLIRNGLAYVNVHTTANPGGHIRGQLVRQQ